MRGTCQIQWSRGNAKTILDLASARTLAITVTRVTFTVHVANIYTGCPKRNGQNFGRVFLMLNYTDITQNTYIQS